MKTAKKLTALLIVLTLIFALSTTAFADYDPTTQYKIKFDVSDYDPNADVSTWTLTPSAGTSVYNAINSSALDSDFTPAGSHFALTRIGDYESMGAELEDLPSTYSIYNNITEVNNHPGYFLLETGPQGYHYLYYGYDWTYCYQGGGDLWDYMDQCFPAAGSVMVVSYSIQEYAWWSATAIT